MALPFWRQERTRPLSWCYWDCVYPSEGGYCGQVLDHTRQNESSIEWYIQAGPYPSPGQCGVRSGDRCEIKYQEDVLLKTGLDYTNNPRIKRYSCTS